MSTSGSQFRLVADGTWHNGSPPDGHADGADPGFVAVLAGGVPLPVVSVPAGLSLLSASVLGVPSLEPLQQLPEAAPGYVVEPVEGAGPARLLLLAVGGALPPRVNGHAAPELALLAPGDEVQIEGGVVLHVTLFHDDPVGPVSRELIGRPCPLCRLALATGDLVYTCPWCGAGFHSRSRSRSRSRARGHGDPDRPAVGPNGDAEADATGDVETDASADASADAQSDAPLECVSLISQCPVCDGAVVREAGFSHQRWT